MTTRTPIDRPLTDPERSLLAYLAARTVADQVPCPLDQAGAALKDLAGRGLVYAHGDAYDAYLTVDGHEIVHAAPRLAGVHGDGGQSWTMAHGPASRTQADVRAPQTRETEADAGPGRLVARLAPGRHT